MREDSAALLRTREEVKVPPLKLLCCQAVAAHRLDVRAENGGESLVPKELLAGVERFPRPFVQHGFHSISQRQLPRNPVRIHLSACTLIVVPPTLLDQWVGEFNKHVNDGCLNLLTIREAKEIPSIDTLLGQDVVIMSQNILSSEDSRRFREFFLSLPSSSSPHLFRLYSTRPSRPQRCVR